MIIDTHVHVYDGGWPPDTEPGLTADEMLKTMDENGVVEAWISPATGLVRDFQQNNDKLYRFLGADRKKLLGFYTVNANYTKEAVDEVKRCAENLGAKGIKLHPWLQGFSCMYESVDRIMEACIRYGLPVLFHDGTPPYSDTMQVANVAERYPEAKVILGHAGLYDSFRDAVKAAQRFDNIYLCLCGNAINDVRYILSNMDNGRILFGSDYGTRDVSLLLERIDIVAYATADEAQRRKVYFENARNLIK